MEQRAGLLHTHAAALCAGPASTRWQSAASCLRARVPAACTRGLTVIGAALMRCNPNLELGTALEQLRTRAFVNSREALHVQAADEEGLANAEREYMEWARAWYVWAQRNAQ